MSPLAPVRLVLPYPPGMNHYWRSVTIGGKARVLISGEGRAYVKLVAGACMVQRAPRGIASRLAVKIEAHEPEVDKNGKKLGVSRDIDNFVKPVLDALKTSSKPKDGHYGVIVDDRQIDALEIVRRERCGRGEVIVTITRLDNPDLLEAA